MTLKSGEPLLTPPRHPGQSTVDRGLSGAGSHAPSFDAAPLARLPWASGSPAVEPAGTRYQEGHLHLYASEQRAPPAPWHLFTADNLLWKYEIDG